MANVVLVLTDTTVAATTVTNQLTTMHSSTPITQLIVGGENVAERAAAGWAVTNGVPWLARGFYFDGAGVNQFARGIFAINAHNPDQVVTAGTAAKPTSAANAATAKGKTLTKL